VNVDECKTPNACEVGDCIDTVGGFECCANDNQGLRANLEASFQMTDIATCSSAMMFCNEMRIGFHVQWFCPQTCNKCDLKYAKRGDPPFLTAAPTLPGQTQKPTTTLTATTITTTLPLVYAVIRFTPDLTNVVSGEASKADFAEKLKVALVSALGASPETILEKAFTVDGQNSNAVVAFASATPGQGQGMRDSLSKVINDPGVGFDFNGLWIMSVGGDGKPVTTTLAPVASVDLEASLTSSQLILIIFGGIIFIGILIWMGCACGGSDDQDLAAFESEKKNQMSQQAIEMAEFEANVMSSKSNSLADPNAFIHNGMVVHSTSELRRSVESGAAFRQGGPMSMAWDINASSTDYLDIVGPNNDANMETSFMSLGESSADYNHVLNSPNPHAASIRDSYINQGSSIVALPVYSSHANTPAHGGGEGAGAAGYIPGDTKPATSPGNWPGAADEWANTEDDQTLQAVLNYQPSPAVGGGAGNGASEGQPPPRIAPLEERIGALSEAAN
jgi:hypothetical protein